MTDFLLGVDSVMVRLSVPTAVALPIRGVLDATGPTASAETTATESVRAIPTFVEAAPAPKPTSNGVTIRQTTALITDPGTGKYAHANPFRDELIRALRFAAEVWGDVPWDSIDESHWTKLLRRRCEQLVANGHKAVRATEITISRLITAVGWLREMRHIPRDAAPWPKKWKEQVVQHWKGVKGSVRDPEPFRPRFTLEESQAILAKTNFDPRLELLMWCGMELRLGQVCRAVRTDLDLPTVDWEKPVDAEHDDADYGTLKVFGSGKKSGTVVDLTRGQRRRIEDALTVGYLATIEAKYQAREVADYCVFPSGYIVGRVGFTRGQSIARTLSEHTDYSRHVSSSWIRKNFREAESRAGVEHIENRCCYGVRRTGRDVADEAGLSTSAIESFGGWQPGSDIPNRIYRDRQNKTGRREARGARAVLRGEGVAEKESTAIEHLPLASGNRADGTVNSPGNLSHAVSDCVLPFGGAQ